MATHPRSDDAEDLHGIEMSERDFEKLVTKKPAGRKKYLPLGKRFIWISWISNYR